MNIIERLLLSTPYISSVVDSPSLTTSPTFLVQVSNVVQLKPSNLTGSFSDNISSVPLLFTSPSFRSLLEYPVAAETG